MIKFIIALSALVMSTMPLLALDQTQQTLIDNFARAYITNRDCDYPLNADRIADDLAKAGLSMADLGKATCQRASQFLQPEPRSHRPPDRYGFLPTRSTPRHC